MVYHKKEGVRMIEICPKCGNYEWDKEITEEKIHCPKCGEELD